MGKQIFNISSVKANDLLKVVRKEQEPCYCIVQFCGRLDNILQRWPFLGEERAKKIDASDYRNLKLIEFDIEGTTWDITLPAEADNSFVSLIDKDCEYTIYTSSIEEIESVLKKIELNQTEKIFEKALSDAKKVHKTFAEIIASTMKKLLI